MAVPNVLTDHELSQLKARAEKGEGDAITKLGHWYRHEGAQQDYSKALQYYQQAANLGYYYAFKDIGLMYENGFGVQQNWGEAMAWYRKGVESGDVAAAIWISFIYEKGKGVEPNPHEAYFWALISESFIHPRRSHLTCSLGGKLTMKEAAVVEKRAEEFRLKFHLSTKSL